MALIGYARVSTEGQDLAPQRAALAAAGCAEIVEETASGADHARPALARLLGLCPAPAGAAESRLVLRLRRGPHP